MGILGYRLSKARKRKNMTQMQLASELGIQQAQVSHFETDKEEPSDAIKARLAEILDVTLDYLEGRTPDEAGNLSDPNVSDSIAHRIRVIRTYYRKSQKEFAKLLCISQSALSALESGITKPSSSVIQKLGNMGFDLHWLIYGDNKEPQNVMLYVEDPGIETEVARIRSLLLQLPPAKIQAVRKMLEIYVSSEKS